MQVRFTTEARNELKRILDVFIEYAGPMSAEKFGNLVDDQIAILLKYPEAGHPEPLLANHKYLFRSKSINKNYRIIYLVYEDTLWIYDFWDRRRDPQWLKERIL
jgi:plasmid stabilization system protein ParE